MSTAVPTDALGVLRRVLQPRERPAPGERCDLCSETIGDRHGHVADVVGRRLMCTCRGCYLLFTSSGAGGLRMRAVPERYRTVDDLSFTQQQWDELAIPVDLVFLFRQSATDGSETTLLACYPSPAGATESEQPPTAWPDLVADNPQLTDLADDVEAVLLRRIGPGTFRCLLVPIDACYELVGIVRSNWTGLSGGAELWQAIDEFFAGLTERARR